MYDPAQMDDLSKDLPSKEDIHYWKHGDNDKDDTTVHRMLDLPEDAKEPENTEEDAKDLEDGRHLYRMVTGYMDA